MSDVLETMERLDRRELLGAAIGATAATAVAAGVIGGREAQARASAAPGPQAKESAAMSRITSRRSPQP